MSDADELHLASFLAYRLNRFVLPGGRGHSVRPSTFCQPHGGSRQSCSSRVGQSRVLSDENSVTPCGAWEVRYHIPHPLLRGSLCTSLALLIRQIRNPGPHDQVYRAICRALLRETVLDSAIILPPLRPPNWGLPLGVFGKWGS